MFQIPSYARAVMAALQFSPPRPTHFFGFSADDWTEALAFCDRARLTLPLALTSRQSLPEPIKARLDHNLTVNAERWLRMKATYEEIASAFRAEGLEFVVLKGFSHCPDFASDPRHRHQYDLDLLLPEQHVFRARDAAIQLGYAPQLDLNRYPLDHLPPMIRPIEWKWRGDYFDPEIPISLELHFRLWDARTERFGPGGLDRFWERREARTVDGIGFAAFHTADALAYAALHLLRHLLRGGLRPGHLYELAWFLDRHAEESPLWRHWREWHGDSLRRLEALCFSLAHRWFDCRLSPAALEEIGRLPPDVMRWLEAYSMSPLAGLFRPNKDELWLHWSLLDSRRDRIALLRRVVWPGRLPDPVAGVDLPWRIRLGRRWRWILYAASRLTHHVRALLPTAWSGLRWFGALPAGPKRDPLSTR
jgi:putative nucleotidyltransferase-like protein